MILGLAVVRWQKMLGTHASGWRRGGAGADAWGECPDMRARFQGWGRLFGPPHRNSMWKLLITSP